MAFLNGDLIDTELLRCRMTGFPHLIAHVLLVDFFHGMPAERELCGDTLDGRVSASLSDRLHEAFGVVRVGCQPCEGLSHHTAAERTIHSANRGLHVHPASSAGESPDAADLTAVERAADMTAGTARRFIPRRISVSTMAWASPKTSLSTPPSGTSGEVIGSVKTVGTEGAKHVTDRNRFFLSVLLLPLLRNSNCYPLDSAKSHDYSTHGTETACEKTEHVSTLHQSQPLKKYLFRLQYFSYFHGVLG